MSVEFKIDLDQLKRMARVYNSDLDAAKAVGTSPHVLAKLWRKHGIESPSQRRIRRKQEAKAGQSALADYNYPFAYKD